LTSDFGNKLSRNLKKMSPKEIEICILLKKGFGNKEISSFLNISKRTVETHRWNIRQKLGIAGKKISLIVHLKTI
jgi:DNA-binding NarL/FixJ family response regulator